jgi:2',3'-cyclic-nucleotide 2'-phosphodiesterase (5'-nucleotidase family)
MKTRLFSLILSLTGIFILSLWLPACNAPGPNDPAAQSGEVRIIIFHTNDMHAKIDRFAKIAWYVQQERKKHKYVFFMNAGDSSSGNPVVDQANPRGEPIRRLLPLMGYDVMTLGNHEFDYGQELLGNFMEQSKFPILCANIDVKTGKIPQPRPFVILETENHIKIAVLGLIQVEKETGLPSSHPDNLKGLAFFDPIETALKYRHLREDNHLFIALTHIGNEEDEPLAGKMPELDVIIGGHSHTVIKEPTETDDVLIAQAGGQAKSLGRIELVLQNGKLIKKTGSLIDVKDIEGEDPEIKKMVAQFNDNPVLKEVVAHLPHPLQGKIQLGNLVTDAVRQRFDLDAAVHNSGGLRVDRLEKEVKLKDVYSLLPFGNYSVRFEMTPAEIASLIRNDYQRHKGLDLQISGLHYVVTRTLEHEVTGIDLRTPDGKPLDETKTYAVGMNDYIASAYKFDHNDPGKSLMLEVAAVTTDYLREINAGKKSVDPGIEKIRGRETFAPGAGKTPLGKALVEISSGADPLAGSSTAGNLAADALRHYTGADIAAYPTHLLEPGLFIPAGGVFHREYVRQFFDFSQKNKPVTGKITGKDLREFILERSRVDHNADLQISGLTYTLNLDEDGRVDSVDCYLPGGKKLSDTAIYTIALNDYEFKNDYKLDKKMKNPVFHDQTVEDTIAAFIKAKGSIGDSVQRQRIKIKSKPMEK